MTSAKPSVELADASTKSDVAVEVHGYSRTIGSGDRVLFDNASLAVSPGERIGIVGANGCGKTTFLRDLLEFGSWEHPTLRIGPSLKVGALHQDDRSLERACSLIDAFQEWTDLSLPSARAMLGRYLFTAGDLEKPLRALSGGERNRLQIARLVAQRATLLLLDEPTNHLDIPAREAVEEALCEFDGTVLAVSHDRYFLDAVATRIACVDSLGFESYPGGFTEFRRVRGASGRSKGANGGNGSDGRRDAGRRRADADRRRPGVHGARREKTSTSTSASTASVESRIIALEEEQRELEKRIDELQQRRDFARARVLGGKLARLRNTIEQLWNEL